jgi:hypothetical protein
MRGRFHHRVTLSGGRQLGQPALHGQRVGRGVRDGSVRAIDPDAQGAENATRPVSASLKAWAMKWAQEVLPSVPVMPTTRIAARVAVKAAGDGSQDVTQSGTASNGNPAASAAGKTPG